VAALSTARGVTEYPRYIESHEDDPARGIYLGSAEQAGWRTGPVVEAVLRLAVIQIWVSHYGRRPRLTTRLTLPRARRTVRAPGFSEITRPLLTVLE
jgi:hypothetical protein